MILLIDNYDSFTGNLYQLILQNNYDVLIKRNDQITLEEIAALDPQGIVISPGPGKPEKAGRCVEIVKQFGASTPMLGVCLGHQVITIAFGGDVILSETPCHGKPVQIFHHRQGLYDGLSLPFQAGRYHSLIAKRDTMPKDLVVEAETGDGLIMGIRHRSYPVYGVQFHPESILTSEGSVLMKNFLGICAKNVRSKR
jgi:anthranilate synthase component 2